MRERLSVCVGGGGEWGGDVWWGGVRVYGCGLAVKEYD